MIFFIVRVSVLIFLLIVAAISVWQDKYLPAIYLMTVVIYLQILEDRFAKNKA